MAVNGHKFSVCREIQVEVQYKERALNDLSLRNDAHRQVGEFLESYVHDIRNYVPITRLTDSLQSLLDSICVCSLSGHDNQILHVKGVINGGGVKFVGYQLHSSDSCLDEFSVSDNEEESVVGSRQWMLPHSQLHQLWNSLVFDSPVKEQLLRYVFAMLKLSDKGVSPHIVTSNRLILLYGPPGTGKTTLCRAVAQRLSIHLKPNFPRAVLVEVNSHSLFSKYFSESGKLVMRLMERVTSLVSDVECLVIVMIDEVESLTMARRQSVASNEPSDAVRVVNALLTQMDELSRHPNVLVMATSNLSDAIDDAFLDRADLTIYIGPPSSNAIYSILVSTIDELQLKGVVESDPKLCATIDELDASQGECHRISCMLQKICVQLKGHSGRGLRRLPTKAYAIALQHDGDLSIPVHRFLSYMQIAIDDHNENNTKQSS